MLFVQKQKINREILDEENEKKGTKTRRFDLHSFINLIEFNCLK